MKKIFNSCKTYHKFFHIWGQSWGRSYLEREIERAKFIFTKRKFCSREYVGVVIINDVFAFGE